MEPWKSSLLCEDESRSDTIAKLSLSTKTWMCLFSSYYSNLTFSKSIALESTVFPFFRTILLFLADFFSVSSCSNYLLMETKASSDFIFLLLELSLDEEFSKLTTKFLSSNLNLEVWLFLKGLKILSEACCFSTWRSFLSSTSLVTLTSSILGLVGDTIGYVERFFASLLIACRLLCEPCFLYLLRLERELHGVRL